MKTSGQFTFVLQVPSVAYVGGPFPLLLGCDGAVGGQLVSFEVRLLDEVMTRGRNVLFREKIATEKREIVVANWTNLSVPLMQEVGTLHAVVPQDLMPTFDSFTVALPEYHVAIEYTVKVGAEVVKGSADPKFTVE